MMMTVTRTIAKSLTLSRQLTLLPQSPGLNRQQLEELDAPLAEGVQPAPEPPVVDSDNFEPATVFEVVENDHDDDGDAHNCRV